MPRDSCITTRIDHIRFMFSLPVEAPGLSEYGTIIIGAYIFLKWFMEIQEFHSQKNLQMHLTVVDKSDKIIFYICILRFDEPLRAEGQMIIGTYNVEILREIIDECNRNIKNSEERPG